MFIDQRGKEVKKGDVVAFCLPPGMVTGFILETSDKGIAFCFTQLLTPNVPTVGLLRLEPDPLPKQ